MNKKNKPLHQTLPFCFIVMVLAVAFVSACGIMNTNSATNPVQMMTSKKAKFADDSTESFVQQTSIKESITKDTTEDKTSPSKAPYQDTASQQDLPLYAGSADLQQEPIAPIKQRHADDSSAALSQPYPAAESKAQQKVQQKSADQRENANETASETVEADAGKNGTADPSTPEPPEYLKYIAADDLILPELMGELPDIPYLEADPPEAGSEEPTASHPSDKSFEHNTSVEPPIESTESTPADPNELPIAELEASSESLPLIPAE